ncbi:MAG: PspA/IM30 family protein, partial [Myxococcaceae bacterium]
GIFRRFWTMLKSNLNHLIGIAEDPEKMLNQTLMDMQEQLISAKRQVAVAIADEKRLIQQYEQEKQNGSDWEQRAMLAVQQSNDNLASQALERQAEHNKLAAGFETNWRAQKQSVEQLKVALHKLSEKITDAKRQKNLLVARARRAEAQKTITETMTGLSSNSALDTMARMEEKINQMEAEADATTELAEEIGHDELLSEFKKLEPVKTSNALLELKAKMGVLPAASQEVKQLR